MTAYDLAQRFVGEIHELNGSDHHPFIQWAHSLCGLGSNQPDETPWCSAWANAIAWTLRLPRSKSAAARSWLRVGVPVSLNDARPGYDVVVLQRGAGPQPGPDVINAPGHVGFFAGLDGPSVLILGGNQGDGVSLAPFPRSRVLGVRRLKE